MAKLDKKIFDNPIWVASGTFGYAEEFESYLDLNEVGAIVTKTITLKAREGNPPPRIVETASGLLNSIGLENKGVDHFIKNNYPFLKKLKANIIISVAGNDAEELINCIKQLEEKKFPAAFEINLSCPNVSHGTACGLFAQDPQATGEIIRELRGITTKPLIAKLSPNVTDISVIAQAAEQSGADAVSLVNTYFGMAVDAEAMAPILGKVTGGLSGPAIKPMALKAVYDTYKKIQIPIVGIGGIMSGKDVAEFMLCGASAVQIGTANFIDPAIYLKISNEFQKYLQRKKITAQELVGGLRKA